MHPARARLIHDRPQTQGPVLYWMHREMRAADNWALLHARELADQRRQPLAVAFCLAREYPLAALPHFAFLLHGLRHTAQELEALGVPFILLRGEPGQAVAQYARDARIGLLVTDADPAKPKRAWLADLLSRLQCPAMEVDSRNVAPARRVSDKAEYMARTIRPKIQRLLPEFLDPFPALQRQSLPWPGPAPATDWDVLLATFGPPPAHFPPGEAAARQRLDAFLRQGLPRYADERNTPVSPASSGLSPYLHFGQLSAQRAALAAMAANAAPQAREAFLEQLIVRRELAENFCLHTPHYDTVEAFPAWARQTLARHRADARPFLASEAQLDAAATPDPLWNAAQRQLLATGHMHGWLRMYWAKQILFWSPDAETALARVLRLNDTLSLDGRDVNGYAGAAWSIGGVHDRPWPERPVFGTVRSMTFSGAARKFDVRAFVSRWSGPEPA
ncbi:Deoxyribodipyrimidine photo-lyase type II [Humidesulfovibrio mexicanus]|uniref:Deoxyribodipyrimidine photo-lyase n=1 Tax=Humidesulfovibrio mexicanus TaxID=147047 RepID=A0A239C479_9BACT|nr:deoxyribodipyrimidine photo-lyase [Humidesulfovibrio mexicanus]SNS14153.1 Deoxyribodipyrimidine photo-lyase type II [Humidesulfovibrio mexicanus]